MGGRFVLEWFELEPRVLPSVAHTNFIRYGGSAHPDQSSSPTGTTPAMMRQAYGANDVTFGSVTGDGAGQTIAIIDAYNQPDIASNLAAFDSYYDLPAPPSFTVVNENGTSSLPSNAAAGTWGIEISLDVEWAHVIAPDAKILLVEANSADDSDLFTAVNTARNYSGVSVVSMSWSEDEASSDYADYDSYFTTPTSPAHIGVTFLAASGDEGAYSSASTRHSHPIIVQYPAASPNVIGVGGTTLTMGTGGDYESESGWGNGTSSWDEGGSGGGISKYEGQPSYQTGVVTQSSSYRTVPDVSMDANPSSGVPVYDTYDFGSTTPWAQYGGTSLATPLYAGVIAIADQGRVVNGLGTLDGATQTLPMLYAMPSSDIHDITTGNNYYAAGTGYDLVTGRGTPMIPLVANYLAGSTTTTLADNGPNPSTYGQSVSFTVTVSPAVPNGETVSLEDASNGNAVVGTGTLMGGTATISVPNLSAGTHELFAVYGGDANYGPSQSSELGQVVQQISTITTLTDDGPNPSFQDVAVNFTVQVSGEPANGETVSLEDASNGNAVVGTGTLSGGAATISVSSLAIGTHDLFAVYGGDTNDTASQSSQVAQIVNELWNQFNGNAQHTGIATVAAQPMDQVLWQTSLDQQGTYFWHTGEPVFTPDDTVIVPIITSTGDTFQLEAFNGATGELLWTAASGYIQPSYSWLPPYQPVYDPASNRVYFAGPGGTLYYISNPDNPGSSTPTPEQVAFYGTASYTANESAYNASIYIDTPLTIDNSGNVFFGFEETGSNPSGISDGGIGRVSATGAGAYVTTGAAVGVGSGAPALGSAPALSNDGSVLYVAINDSSGPYLVGVNATTLAPEYSVLLSVPNSDTGVYLINQSTAAPMVAPDGTVFMGVFADDFDGSRGFMTHYSANLETEYAPGAFGWDDTASIIPTSMVPSYTGTSPYLILTKYNNYVAGEVGSSGGSGVNEIAVLDPYATETDPNNDPNPSMLVMKQVMTITSPTEDSGWINNGYPDATREWCTNGTAVDPATDSVFINNEDGYSYRWDLATNTITQAVEITDGYGEPYTPTAIGPNGVIYAINGGTLFALGGYSNYTLTNDSSLTPADVGQSATFTTTLASTDGGAVPTGSITYSYTSGTNNPLNSTPVTLGTVPLVNGQASFTTSSLVPDHYHIIATYSGDAADGYAAGSTTLVQVVLANPTVSLTTSASPIQVGQSVTFTATVNPDGVFFVPLGTVSFMDGSTLLGTVALNSLDHYTSPSSSQTVTLTTASLPVGTDAITAVYSGDLNFAGVTSSPLTETVNPPIAISSININAGTAPILRASESGSTATFTTDGASGFAAGDPVVIAGVGGGYDGTYTIASVNTGINSFAVNFGSNTGLATITGTGTATDTAQSGGPLVNGTATGSGNEQSASYNSQRSMVDSIVYKFNQAINLAANAFTISVLGEGGQVPTISYASADGGVTWVVTFSGNGVIGNSIANGEYQIVLSASAVSAVADNGTLASNDTESFYRLFGNIGGSESVGTAANRAFDGTFGLTAAQAGYLAYFDYNDGGSIGTVANRHFDSDFGVSYSGFTATI